MVFVIRITDHIGDSFRNATGGDYTTGRTFYFGEDGFPISVRFWSSCEISDCCPICDRYEYELNRHIDEWHYEARDRIVYPAALSIGHPEWVECYEIEKFPEVSAFIPPECREEVLKQLNKLFEESEETD